MYDCIAYLKLTGESVILLTLIFNFFNDNDITFIDGEKLADPFEISTIRREVC